MVFTHLEGPLILSPDFPSRPGGAYLVCFPLVIRFMMGKAGFPLTQQTPLPSLPVSDSPTLGSPAPAS